MRKKCAKNFKEKRCTAVIILSHSPEETKALAARLRKVLAPGTVVALRGGMGAGKTTFVAGMTSAASSSPTFELVHDYGDLVHTDMYRVGTFEDLCATGFFEYLDAGAVVAVEWSENIAAFLPPRTVTVTLETVDENTRRITIDGVGGMEESV